MPAGVDRIQTINAYIDAGTEKIRQARALRDSDIRDLAELVGPTEAARRVGLSAGFVKTLKRRA